ncbi:hypothetical protein F5148DRAFT_552699 [Russula earlei]|uniref:Uncharacterized protein n=1 Tax=Russula earlei TaxID=71964 RepID=A0ACC0TWY8_9AGAM|nr:hypothetical protein F5148DRAFT_552699 [Russula earlei]
MSAHQPNAPPHDSAPAGAGHSVPAPLATAQTVLSFLGHANAAREHPSDPSTAATALGAAQTVLSRLASSSSSTPPAVPHPALAVKPIPELPQEHPAEASPHALVPPAAEASRRPVSDPSVPGPTSVSSHGGASGSGNGGNRAITPPRGTARVTRSYSALPEAIPPPPPPPRPVYVSHGGGAGVYRRPTTLYPDSEAAWLAHNEGEIVRSLTTTLRSSWPADHPDGFSSSQSRERNVEQRLATTIKAAKDEFDKSTKQASQTDWLQTIAIGLQVLIGALTTALGAALSGKNTSVAISILGGTSTLVASYLARTKGSNEPQQSQQRSQALDHFLREINSFVLDHGHEVGNKWDDKIHGYRFGLEVLLGNKPGSVTVNPETGPNNGQEKGSGLNNTSAGSQVGGNGFVPPRKEFV